MGACETEYYEDQAKPVAREFLLAAFAAVRNAAGQLLLVRRADDGLWELPGGRMEVAEYVSAAVVREIAEETAVAVRTTAVAGAYSDPEHLLAYPDGGIYQQPAIQKVPGQPGERYAQGQAIMLG
jgi:ADP-ribose pyrophosphatase YjhB (NUDIX family)